MTSATSETLRPLDLHKVARAELAAAFRWTARLGMHEAVANHFSLSVDATGKRFLINPNHSHFALIRASDLLEIDADDPATMDRPDVPNITAWGLHGALHRMSPHARCALHVHSINATALACLEDPRLPAIDQNSAMFHGRVAIDQNYGGMAIGDEAERACQALRDPRIRVLVMGNHGVMVIGETVAQAFTTLYYFEKSAETYLKALSTGRPLAYLPDEVAERVAGQTWDRDDSFDRAHFAALRRILDREEPDYAD